MKLFAIILAIAGFMFSGVGTHASTQEDYWMYCQENPVVCWVANPTIVVSPPTITPDPSSVPSSPLPFACPGGGVVNTNNLCPSLPSRSGMVVTGDVNLRAGPGTNYPSYGVVKTGTSVVQVNDAQGIWVPVSVDGQVGWISGSYISGN